MNQLYLVLSRLAVWLDSERIGAAGTAYYGLHIWLFRSFAGSSAFSVYAAHEEAFAIPLLVGATLQAWGLKNKRALPLLLGQVVGFAVFSAALLSCLIINARSTGVPAYLTLSVYSFALALRTATGRQYSFRP